MLAFLWAEGRHGVIGYQGHLPWHLPRDMQFFKALTTGHTIVTGSRTYQSFKRPLPHRRNIVLTSDLDATYPEEVLVIHTVSELRRYQQQYPNEQIYVIGGAQVFASLLDEVTDLYQTLIHADFPGDTVMPPIDWTQFQLVSRQPGIKDADNPYDFEFLHYRRR